MAGIVEGKPLDVCVDMGQWLAKLSIQELGPQYVFYLSFYYHPSPTYFIALATKFSHLTDYEQSSRKE